MEDCDEEFWGTAEKAIHAKNGCRRSNVSAGFLMAMPPLPDAFKEFLKLLDSNGVEYLVIGGYAVNVYGYLRTTNDLDVWVNVNPKNAAGIDRALR